MPGEAIAIRFWRSKNGVVKPGLGNRWFFFHPRNNFFCLSLISSLGKKRIGDLSRHVTTRLTFHFSPPFLIFFWLRDSGLWGGGRREGKGKTSRDIEEAVSGG